MQAVRSSSENFVDDEGTLPLGLELVLFSSLVGVERVHQCYMFWPALLYFDTFEHVVDRMRNELLQRRAPPPRHLNCPVDPTRLLSLHTCALEVSHE